jgi:thiol-disulfide isomerase/thioredoxin
MTTKIIITELKRDTFNELLTKNPGVIIIKFSATWCAPCKKIEPIVHNFFSTSPPNVICCDLDIDINFDLYSFFKFKKMVNGIPVMLCFTKDNLTFVPSESCSGTNLNDLDTFFKACNKHSQLAKSNS